MSMYLSTLEIKARLNIGKEVEQWLSYVQLAEYAFIKWLVIYKDKNQFTVTYFESFDEGNEEFHDIHEFSVLDPEDFPHGIANEFDSLDAAVAFAIENYEAVADRFVAGGMIQKEYVKHLNRNKLSM